MSLNLYENRIKKAVFDSENLPQEVKDKFCSEEGMRLRLLMSAAVIGISLGDSPDFMDFLVRLAADCLDIPIESARIISEFHTAVHLAIMEKNNELQRN
jgi:hypothetical protein